MKILTIDRRKWRRGGAKYFEQFGETQLLNEQGMMCCLGFESLRCGLTEQEILGKEDPAELPKIALDNAHHLLDDYFIAKAIETNDDHHLNSRQREEQLKELFAEKGITLKFIGD